MLPIDLSSRFPNRLIALTSASGIRAAMTGSDSTSSFLFTERMVSDLFTGVNRKQQC